MSNAQKPFSQACENNKTPILNVLKDVFCTSNKVLEVGSGTGQHAVHFAENLQHLVWQPSEVAENLSDIELWLNDANLSNMHKPIELNVDKVDASKLKNMKFDAAYTANTFHIMSWFQVYDCIKLIADVLEDKGYFCVYGPFNYNGKYTSDSNKQFDLRLQARDPLSGLRNMSDVLDLTSQFDLQLQSDHEMPVNNRLLVFKKVLREQD